MRRGNNSGSNGQSLDAAPVTAHTLAKAVIRPPGYHFVDVRTDNNDDCLLPLLAEQPRVYWRPSLLDQVRSMIDAGAETVCYPQDSTPTADGQVVNKLA